MKSARYGRMRFGRCVREDHGSLGCFADVLPQLSARCSGRRSCSVYVPDPSLHDAQSCPKELMPYLETSYTCVTGEFHIKLLCCRFINIMFHHITSAAITVDNTAVHCRLLFTALDCYCRRRPRIFHRLSVPVYGLGLKCTKFNFRWDCVPGPLCPLTESNKWTPQTP